MTTGFDIIGNNKALQDHWLRRFFALVIDGLVIYVFVFVIGLFLIFWPFWGWVWWLIWGVIALPYFVMFELVMKATPGKKILSMEVVGTDKELDFMGSMLRNISKVVPFLLLIDWIIGMFTEGDPRQKMLDRYANTTVQRTDQQAYMEQQFRQMAYVPPHPTYQPPPGQPQQPSYQPQQQPQGQAPAWPHQEQKPKTDWPEHDPGQAPPQQQNQPPPQQQQNQPPPQQQASQPPPQDAPRFCQNCGTTLTPGPDGRQTCGNCGKTY